MSGGQRFKPRLVREIEDVVTHEKRLVAADALEPLPYRPEHIELILRALHGVTQEGTSTRVFAGAPYKSGGKTGTAQAVGIKANQKYDASKLEEHKRDHSLYIAAAPLPDPSVVVAVIVENAGFGAAAAAPIARRVRLPCSASTRARGHRRHAPRPVAGADRHAARWRRAAAGEAGRRCQPPPSRRPRRHGSWHSAGSERGDRRRRRQRRSRRSSADLRLAVAIGGLAALGLLSMHSAASTMARASSTTAQHADRAGRAARRRAGAPQRLILAVPPYVLGVALLIVTALPGVGITKKGATRWLYVGTVIQPSEIMKTPCRRCRPCSSGAGQLRVPDFLVAGALLVVPVG